MARRILLPQARDVRICAAVRPAHPGTPAHWASGQLSAAWSLRRVGVRDSNNADRAGARVELPLQGPARAAVQTEIVADLPRRSAWARNRGWCVTESAGAGWAPQPFSDDVADGVKAGDPDAVGAVYACLSDRLLGYLMARVKDRATAEDLLEGTFIELLLKGHTIRGGPAAIKVWLFRAAHFNALDHLRKLRRRPEDLIGDPLMVDVTDPDRGPAEHATAADLGRRVRSALQHLSDDQRQVLVLRYVGGLSAPEVAEVMGKTDGAIRSLQHRGERALARVLGQHGAPAPSPASQTSMPQQA